MGQNLRGDSLNSILRRQGQFMDVILALAQGDKGQIDLAVVHFAAENPLGAQLVKAAAFGTAGVGPRDIAGILYAGADVDVAQRQIVQTGNGDIFCGHRAIAAALLGIHIGVEHHQVQLAVCRDGKALQQAVTTAVGGKGGAVYHRVELGQLHRFDFTGTEDMYVVRPGIHRVGGAVGIVIVIAGGDKHGDLKLTQCAGKGLDGLLIDPVAVQQVAGKQHHFGTGGMSKVHQPVQNLTLLGAALDGLLRAQTIKGRIQMEIRGVNNTQSNPPHSRSSTRTTLVQRLVLVSMVKRTASILQGPSALSKRVGGAPRKRFRA